MIDTHMVKGKLADIEAYYGEMQPLLAAPSRALIEDTVRLHALERLFQLLVDTAIDVNTHLIAELELPVPEDYQNTFETVGRYRVFPVSFALEIGKSVGLRNKVVHKYGEVDLKRMVDEIKAGIPQYLEYAKYIQKYLDTLSE